MTTHCHEGVDQNHQPLGVDKIYYVNFFAHNAILKFPKYHACELIYDYQVLAGYKYLLAINRACVS